MFTLIMSRTIDGSNPFTVPNTFRVFTSGSGTYIPPAGCKFIVVEMCGGGGGGGKGAGLAAGGGGNAGAYLKVRNQANIFSYTVGVGGLGTSVNGTNGLIGTNTLFGGCIAQGGLQGFFDVNVGALATTTTAAGFQTLVSLPGQRGADLQSGSSISSPGGSNILGVNAQRHAAAVSPDLYFDAYGYGSGGSGVNSTPGRSGNGAPGIIIIEEFY